MDFVSEPESKLISLICQLHDLVEILDDTDTDSVLKVMPLVIQVISLVISMDLDSQPKPESKLISLITQTISIFNSMDLDSQPEPLKKVISLISHNYLRIDSDLELDQGSELLSLLDKAFGLEPAPELLISVSRTVTYVKDVYSKSESELISLITKLVSRIQDSDRDTDANLDPKSKFLSLARQLIFLVSSVDLNSQPKPESKLMSLCIQLMSLSDGVNLDLDLDLESELGSLIQQIFSLVISMDSKLGKLISLCPQVQVIFAKGKFNLIREVSWSTKDKWDCLPVNWGKFWFTGEEDFSHFHCQGCNGHNHEGYEKAPVEIKHLLHPKHSLQLALLHDPSRTRDCYCCDENTKEIFYYCSACDFAINFTCMKKQRVLSMEHPKWHEHPLSLFPSKTFLTCSLCPPCDFMVHQKCFSLPRVIRISRHSHRISFSYSFKKGDWFCGVCCKKINNDYGGYSCIVNGCLYTAHSKCATQFNVWDGVELENVPKEIEEEETEPFVRIREGIIQHFSHLNHHLRLDIDTGRDYDENKLCEACIMPIYSGNFYSCMQCNFILHEECAKLSRKIHSPIHRHMLTLVAGYEEDLDYSDWCQACGWLCRSGFFYKCISCGYICLHVQCATISEPLVHGSHKHPLFLTSVPGEGRICSVCKKAKKFSTDETFNCIEECDFSLCFRCATLPQKARYKHDKHMLTLSYGEKTNTMMYWCEGCEGKLDPKERFYRCNEYCCVTLHIECLIGKDMYIKPGLKVSYYKKDTIVLPNNQHMSRPFCSFCEKRCPHKMAVQGQSMKVYCSRKCIRAALKSI